MDKKHSPSIVLSQDQLLEFAIFLVTSARNCVDEPELYGAFRLTRALSKLLKLGLDRTIGSSYYWELVELEVDNAKLALNQPESFVQFLDDLTQKLVMLLAKGGAGTHEA